MLALLKPSMLPFFLLPHLIREDRLTQLPYPTLRGFAIFQSRRLFPAWLQ